MNIKEAIQEIGTKTPIMLAGALEALESNNKTIEFVNTVLEQYYETEGNKKTLINIYGEEVLNTLIDWAKKEARFQEILIQYKSLMN